jgi:anti-sigma B factor antagonist
MGVECFTIDDVMVLRVSGALDQASAEALREGACTVLVRPQQTVLVNLDRVLRIDAAGLGALADIHRMAGHVGGRVTLTNVRARVREMLDVAALTACFEIAASECDAVEDADPCIPEVA